MDVKVPRLAESISEAVLVEWLKPDGAQVKTDEAIATLETDKAAVEIAAPEAGVLRHARKPGERVLVGDVMARIEQGSQPSAPAQDADNGAPATPSSAPPAATATEAAPLSPSVRRLVEEHRLEPATIEATGKGGRLLKEDVLRHLETQPAGAAARPAEAAPSRPSASPAPAGGTAAPVAAAPNAAAEAGAPAPASTPPRAASAPADRATPAPAASASPAPTEPMETGEDERIVPMSRIRQRIAERLVRAQQTAAILTTFNEIDMSAAMELRGRYKEGFERRYGVRLGFMSFFTRACVLALQEIPELNAEVRGTDIVYRRRIHVGVAVGTDRGLVVPVLRDAQRMGFADIEREIARLADKAREGTLSLDELSGGTFTISNGGVYGSLFSTPILNPPQSGILGMHKIEKRPIAVGDQVAIRPMMYVALSYDHRIVDGEQAVTFLVRVKERLEDPGRMLLDV